MAIYPCGCSSLKVKAGLCSIYGEDGNVREEPMDSIKMSVGDMANAAITATITVRGLKRFSFRCWLGCALLHMAARVFPFTTGVEVEVDSRNRRSAEVPPGTDRNDGK